VNLQLLHDENWICEPMYSKIKSKVPLPCVDLLVIHNGKLLLMLRNNQPAKDLWFTPGGRVYRGELLEQTVQRVLKQETGLEVLKVEQIGAMSHLWPESHTVTVIYVVHVSHTNVDMNSEHRAFKWIDLPSHNLHPYVQEMVQRSELFK
jgi:colanic acid biosynthesis protein WcaH